MRKAPRLAGLSGMVSVAYNVNSAAMTTCVSSIRAMGERLRNRAKRKGNIVGNGIITQPTWVVKLRLLRCQDQETIVLLLKYLYIIRALRFRYAVGSMTFIPYFWSFVKF